MKPNYSWILFSLVAVFFLAGCGGMKPKGGGGKKKPNNNAQNENRRENELKEEVDDLRRQLEQANFERGLQVNPNAFGSSSLRPGDIEAFRDGNGQLSTIGGNNNFANANQLANNGGAQTQDFEALPSLPETEIKRALVSNPSAHGGVSGTPIRRRRVE